MEINKILITAKKREIRKIKRLGFEIKSSINKKNNYSVSVSKNAFQKNQKEKEKRTKKEKERDYIHSIYNLISIFLENKDKKALGIIQDGINKILVKDKDNGNHFASQSDNCFASQNRNDRNFDNVIYKRKKISFIKKTRRVKNKNLFSKPENNRIYENILEEIFKLGNPFTKHRKGSGTYQESIKLVEKYFKKYRTCLLDIFTLAKEYFSNPDFVYHPKRIGVPTFFEYTAIEKSQIPSITKLNVNSWFKEFQKGRENIESKFMRVRTDSNPELTEVIIKYWKDFRRVDNISAYEKRAFVLFTSKIKKYAKINTLSVRTIFEVISNQVFKTENPMAIVNPYFFNSDYFFNELLPQILISNRIVKSKRELKKLK